VWRVPDGVGGGRVPEFVGGDLLWELSVGLMELYVVIDEAGYTLIPDTDTGDVPSSSSFRIMSSQ
jgi:hypothetical protein